jgi:hypothetical protein
MKLLRKYIKKMLTEQTNQQVYMHGTTQAGLEAIQKCNCLHPGKRGFIHAFFDDSEEEAANKEDVTALYGGRGFEETPVFIKFTTHITPTRERGIAVVWNVEKLPIQILGIES